MLRSSRFARVHGPRSASNAASPVPSKPAAARKFIARPREHCNVTARMSSVDSVDGLDNVDDLNHLNHINYLNYLSKAKTRAALLEKSRVNSEVNRSKEHETSPWPKKTTSTTCSATNSAS